MHNHAVEVHLPCPPLDEWLTRRANGLRVGAWQPGGAPRRVREILASWPTIAEASESQLDPGQLELLLFGTSLEQPEPPQWCLDKLGRGAWVFELAVPRPRPVRTLLGLERRPLVRAAAGQSRVLDWLARGYHQIEQWESVEPAGVIVTVARVR